MFHVELLLPMFHVELRPKTQILRSPQGNRIGSDHAICFVDWSSRKSSSPNIRPIFGERRGISATTSFGFTALETNESNTDANSSPLCATTETLARVLVASLKKTALRWLDSTKLTFQSGFKIAMGTPGKPAPLPMSAIELALFSRCAAKNRDSQ